MKKIAFITCEKLKELAPGDQHLVREIEDRGHRVIPWVWNSGAHRAADFDLIVMRTPWDYFEHLDEFERFLRALPADRTHNPKAVLLWNLDKVYLQELASAGIPIVDTRWLRSSDERVIDQFLRQGGEGEWVVKPSRSAGAHKTYRFQSTSPPDAKQFLGEMILLQKFLPEIISEGEYSLIYFDGKFSHALVKRAKEGDFRIQEKYGGRTEAVSLTPALERMAKATLGELARRFGEPVLYARIDCILRNGEAMLMELEVLEPDLYFGIKTHSVISLADLICAKLS